MEVRDLFETDERISPENIGNIFQRVDYERHRFAYESVKEFAKKESNILEVGCGEGYGAWCLSSAGFSVVAADVDQKLQIYASEKYGVSDSLKFLTIEPDVLPFKDESFDVVISFQVVEHTHNIDMYLDEIYRVLKKDGVFLCTTPNRLIRLAKKQKPWNIFHVTEFSPSQLKQIVERCFENVNLLGVFGNAQVSKLEYRRLFYLKKKEIGDYFRLMYFYFIMDRLLGKFFRKKNVLEESSLNAKAPFFRVKKRGLRFCLDIFIIAKK